MKPYNKMRWQKANAKLARKPLDDFEKWMNELCEKCGIRHWDCLCPTKDALDKAIASPESASVAQSALPVI